MADISDSGDAQATSRWSSTSTVDSAFESFWVSKHYQLQLSDIKTLTNIHCRTMMYVPVYENTY